MPSSCTSQASHKPLRSGKGDGSRCQAVARTPEAYPSTYPTTPNTRDHAKYPISCPDSRTPACLLAHVDRPRVGCGCGSTDDLLPQSSPGKSGTLVRPAQEANAGQKTHSLGRPGAVRDSRTVVSHMRARGGSGLRTWHVCVDDHDGL